MYISNVVTYGRTKSEIESSISSELSDIRAALLLLNKQEILDTPSRYSVDGGSDRISLIRFKDTWERLIKSKGWRPCSGYITSESGRKFQMRNLGHAVGKVSCELGLYRDSFSRWLYTTTPIAHKNSYIDTPILIMPVSDVYAEFFDRVHFGPASIEFDRVLAELKELEPLSHQAPFVLVGLSAVECETEWLEILSERKISESKVVINRSLEFPPEFRQAGLGILNYFGEVLREKYPDEKAKVRIEQDGLSVRMIVETEDGSREVIEKALQEYELVISGKKPPEYLFEDRIKVLELKQELRIAEARIEGQKEIIQYQRQDISDLKNLFGTSLTSQVSPIINLTASPCIAISNVQANKFESVFDIEEALEELNILLNCAGDSELKTRINDLCESVESLEQKADAGPDRVRTSIGLIKLKKFIDDSVEKGSKLNGFIESLSDGVGVVKGLAAKYNALAEWCGAPQVPRIFID